IIVTSLLPPPPRSTLFPYTTLFRSQGVLEPRAQGARQRLPAREGAAQRPVASLWTAGVERRRERDRQRDLAEGAHGEERDAGERSEEHTSELQSPYDLVCRLLLEKK